MAAITSMLEYLDRIFMIKKHRWKLRDDAQDDAQIDRMWFRGTRNVNYELIPRAYWKKCAQQELNLFSTFQSNSLAYLNKIPMDNWEWYFLMQHYGLPTRLIDWTENPLTALYFAITYDGKIINKKVRDAPGVFIMDPCKLNSITNKNKQENIALTISNGIDNWLPQNIGDDISANSLDTFINNDFPIAVFPYRNNPRIIAQKGCFTIHGKSNIGIKEIFKKKKLNNWFCKININKDKIDKIKKELESICIDQATYFPELSSVANDIMRQYHI